MLRGKKLISALLVIWLIGAVAMSIYYDVERKSNCISREGFWKGWLWCSTDPKTNLALSVHTTRLLLKGLAWPLKPFLKDDEQLESSQQPAWSAQRHEARIVIKRTNDSGESLYSILLVNYNPNFSCRAELSFLGVNGKKLGDPIRQDRQFSILRLAVGETQSTEYKAVKTEYSNGFEFAVELHGDMLSKMQRGLFVEVRADGYAWNTRFPLTQFNVSNESARRSCAKT